jgi:RHS repeat-associated protein
LEADFSYTGHYFHQPSGLNLALYRGYNPSSGRWLNRDPIAEKGGINLYGYVSNNPVNVIDPLGLDAVVLLNSHAVSIGRHFAQGHIATLIGNNATGWTYHSRNGYNGWPWQGRNGDFTRATFPTFQDFKNSGLADQYDQAYHIQTTPDQDQAMIEYGDEHYDEHYHSIIPPSNNCADLTEEILEAGGQRICGYNQYPVVIRGLYIGSPEVPKFLFPNVINSKFGRLWNVRP